MGEELQIQLCVFPAGPDYWSHRLKGTQAAVAWCALHSWPASARAELPGYQALNAWHLTGAAPVP